MKIFKSFRKKHSAAVINALCLLALLFVWGCQCQGELGTKANKTTDTGVASTAFDNK